jgi:hypothetical protein
MILCNQDHAHRFSSVYRQHVDVLRKCSDFLKVWAVVIVSVQFGEFDSLSDVFCENPLSRQMSVELGGEHSDTLAW